jgi:hypothetical protein
LRERWERAADTEFFAAEVIHTSDHSSSVCNQSQVLCFDHKRNDLVYLEFNPFQSPFQNPSIQQLFYNIEKFLITSQEYEFLNYITYFSENFRT